MTFLAPWALAAGVIGALGMVLLHLVAWQRPAAYVLPTTRFIPDQRTVVSRAATRPRDVLLLVLRVLALLAAAAAFARPVLTPAHGTIATIVLADRSRSVADPADVARRVAAHTTGNAPVTVIAFDSAAVVVGDSAFQPTPSSATGSLSAALALSQRQARGLAERADSVRLILISPFTRAEADSATAWLRAKWPGGVTLERVAARQDSASVWHLETALSVDDPLGPAMHGAQSGGTAVRLVRTSLAAGDSAFAQGGGTVVLWPRDERSKAGPEGLVVGNDVLVTTLGRAPVQAEGRAVAHWADGDVAAREVSVGRGCVRVVGVRVPEAGDLPLHAPFQRVARSLLRPCGAIDVDVPASDSVITRVVGTRRDAASAASLRGADAPPTPLVKWLLVAALLFALAELVARSRMQPQGGA